MALDGAKFVCLSAESDGGSPVSGQLATGAAEVDVSVEGRVVEAKGRKFTVGYYMNCDYVLDDRRAKGVHCEIQCDAFGRVTIHNLSEEHPISVNEQIISIKRPLLHGSRIRILDKEFLWKFPKNSAGGGGSGSEDEDLSSAETSTPQKSAAEQPPSSCPLLKLHRSVTKRFTVHNFAYCIQSDEEGNTSAETSHITNTTAEEVDEMQTPEKAVTNSAQALEKSNRQTPATTTAEMASELATVDDTKSASAERCVTPGAVAVDSHLIDVLETPKMNLINCTKNKENKSTEKKQQLLSLCNQSDVVITSFSPRETGVRIAKSFTAVLKPAAATPKSVYSTPKSVLSEYNDDCSRDFIDFSTPATSKKTLATRLATNSSMHLIDLTTPAKLRPASPQSKTALKSVSKRLPELPEEKATSSKKAAVLLDEGVSALPASPVTSSDDGGKKNDLPTPGSAASVISVDGSTDMSSVIELSGEDSTPGVSGTTQTAPKTPRQASNMRKVTTPMRTPQSLMKRAILTSAKKQASAARLASAAANSITPTRKVAVSNTMRVAAGTSSSPATPKSTSASTKAALVLKQRQSLSATSRRSLVAQKLKLENSPRGSLSAMDARGISTSTPLQPRILATSSSVAAKLRNTSPLHGVRKSVGNTTLPSHISKTRKSIVLAGRRTPPSLSAQLVAKARKSLCGTTSMSNARSRNLVAAAVSAGTPKSSAASGVSGVSVTVSHESCVKLQKPAESAEVQADLDSGELSRTFIVDDSFAEEASPAVLSEIAGKDVEKTAEEHKDITFSPAKIRRSVEHDLNRTFSSENPSKLVDSVTETPIDVAEVHAASPVLDMVPTDVIRSVELFDEPVGSHSKDAGVIAENFAESVELVTSEAERDEDVGSTVDELLESAPLMDATNAVDEPVIANNIERVIKAATVESSEATEADAMPCGSNNAAVECLNKPEEEEIAVESTTETVESLKCVGDKELELTKAEVNREQTLLETAPDTNNISSTTHTVSVEHVEDTAPEENTAQMELEAVVETVEKVAQAGPDRAQDVQNKTGEETANDIVPVTPTTSDESAALTATIETASDQDQNVENESEPANRIFPVTSTEIDASVAMAATVEAVSGQDQDAQNESEPANKIFPVTSTEIDASVAMVATVEFASDHDQEVENELEPANKIFPLTSTEIDASVAMAATVEAASGQDQDAQNESEPANKIFPVTSKESDASVAMAATVEAASDHDQEVENELEPANKIFPLTSTESDASVAMAATVEAASGQNQDAQNESEPANRIVKAASDHDQEVENESEPANKIFPVNSTESDASVAMTATLEAASDQNQDVQNESEPANGIGPVTLTDADAEVAAIAATGESEETAMLLEEIEYVLNKSDELQQKQIERCVPDQPTEHSKEVSSNKLDSICYSDPTQENVDTTDKNKPEIVDQETTTKEQMVQAVVTDEAIEETITTEEIPTKVKTVSSSEAKEATLLDTDNVEASLIQTAENMAEMSASSGTEKSSTEKSLETPIEKLSNTTENIESITTEKQKEPQTCASTTAKTTTTTEDDQPHAQPSPLSPNLCGVRELLKTPTRAGAKTPDLVGLRHLVRTPMATKRHLDADDGDSFETLHTLLKTPHHSKKSDLATTSTPHAEPATTFTPRRSARRRASASAEITPTYTASTPRRTTRRRASESADALSITVGPFTPKRITARRPSLSLDEDATLTPRTRGTRAKRLATFAEHAEDMGAIVEEAPKEVADSVDRTVTLTDTNVELPPKDVVLEEDKSKTNVESAISELQAKVEEESVAPVCKIIEESICEEVPHVQRVGDEKAAPVGQETVAQPDEVATEDLMDKEAAVVEAKVSEMPSVKDIDVQEVEDGVSAADREVTDDYQNKPPHRALHELANSPAEILDESDYEYGKEVAAAKQPHSEPATTSATAQTGTVNSSGMDAETPKSRKMVKFEEPSPKTPAMIGVREMLKTPKAVAATPKLLGVRELVRTPKSSTRPDDDEELEGLAELVKTPKVNVKGAKEDEPPSTSAEAHLAYLGMREMLKTPKYSSTPLLKGVREMMQTPKSCSTPQLGGIKQLMETPIRSADDADVEQPLKQDLLVAAMTDLNETVTEGLDKFFKTPRAKDMMIPGLPPSAVIEQNTESVGLIAATEYDLNATPERAAHMEDIFKTPVSTRFAERITDSCAMDEAKELADESVEEVTNSVTPVKEANSSRESKNLSAEEAFDELIGQATQLDKTPTHKVYSRKSHTNTAQPSPFSASDVISDLPRTDIQEWVDNLETEEVDSDYAADVTELEKEEHEISVTPSMLEHGAQNDSRDPIADSAHEQSTCIKAETLMSVSVASSAVDPLLGSVCKAEDQMGLLQTVEEEESVRATTPVESEMSGINLLDQTNESIFSEPLLVSDSDSVDENKMDEKEKITRTYIENITLGDDEELEKMHIRVDEIAPKMVEDNKVREKDEENVEDIPHEEKDTENVEHTAPHGNDSDEKDNFPIMLIDSDTDSSVIEETPAKSRFVPKVKTMKNRDEPFNKKSIDEGGTSAVEADRDEVENEPNQDIKAEFDKFKENAVVLRPRSSTPDQRKARAKLSRKTLGAEEDLQLTLDLELEKAELEKARLIEVCARQAANKVESVICLDEDENEQGAEEKTAIIDAKSNENEKIAGVEVKATDKEDNIICLDENEGEFDKFKENAVVLRPRSSTPDQRKARAKLSRKTLGAEEDLQLTLDLELEKAELEKARLIEVCARQAANKVESVICLDEDENEQGAEEKTAIIDAKSNENEKIAGVEVKATDKEDNIICLDENEGEFDKFKENAVVLRPRSSTPDQRKARAKLSRKTLGAEEDLQLTLDLELEKAELEKARLIEVCARQAANKVESVICLDEDENEQGAEEKTAIIDAKSNENEKIAGVEVIATDKEDNIICLDENEGVEDEKAVVEEEEVTVDAKLVDSADNAESSAEAAVVTNEDSENLDSKLASTADSAEPLITERKSLLNAVAEATEPVSERSTDESKAAEKPDLDKECSIVEHEEESDEVPTEINTVEEIVTPPEVAVQIIEDISTEGVVDGTEIASPRSRKQPAENVEDVGSTEHALKVAERIERDGSVSLKTREKSTAEADISIMHDETKFTSCSSAAENLAVNESRLDQPIADSPKTAVSENVEHTVEVSIILNETKPTSSASATEKLAVNESRLDQLIADSPKTAVSENLEFIAEVKAQPAVVDNVEEESSDKNALGTELAEVAPKRRGRKGSRSKQQTVTNDKQPEVAPKHDTLRPSPAIDEPLEEEKAAEKLSESVVEEAVILKTVEKSTAEADISIMHDETKFTSCSSAAEKLAVNESRLDQLIADSPKTAVSENLEFIAEVKAQPAVVDNAEEESTDKNALGTELAEVAPERRGRKGSRSKQQTVTNDEQPEVAPKHETLRPSPAIEEPLEEEKAAEKLTVVEEAIVEEAVILKTREKSTAEADISIMHDETKLTSCSSAAEKLAVNESRLDQLIADSPKTAVSENVEHTVEVSIILNETKPTSSASATESSEILTVNKNQQNESIVDSAKTAVSENIEFIAEVKAQPAVVDNAEEESTDKNALEKELAEVAPKRRGRKGSRSKQQTVTDDEQPAVAPKHETLRPSPAIDEPLEEEKAAEKLNESVVEEVAHNKAQIFISTDYEIRIKDVPENGAEVLKEVPKEAEAELKMPVDDTNAERELGELKSVDADEQITKQINTHSSNPVTECDTEQAESIVAEPTVAAEMELVSPPAEVEETVATVIVAEETKVRKRTRKGSQSSQCSTQEDSMAPKRRGGRRKAGTPIEVIADSSNSSDHTEISNVAAGGDLAKRRRGNKKVGALLEEVVEDVKAAGQDEEVIEQAVIPDNEELHQEAAVKEISAEAASIGEPTVEVRDGGDVTEDHIRIDKNKTTIDTLVEKQLSQKRTRRKAPVAEVSQSSSFVDSNEASTSRRRRGRKNTEESNGSRTLEVQKTEMIENATNKHINTTKDITRDDEIVAETLDTATGIISTANEEQIIEDNEREATESAKEEGPERHSTPGATKRQYRGRRNRQLSVTITDENEAQVRPTVEEAARAEQEKEHAETKEPTESKKNAKTVGGRARTARRRQEEVKVVEEEIADSHEEKELFESVSKPSEETAEEASPKEKALDEMEKAAPRHRGGRKAKDPDVVELPAPKRRGGKRRLHEELTDQAAKDEPEVSEHDSTAVRPAKVKADMGRKQEELESELHDAPGGDETEEDAAQTGRKRRGAAVAATAVAKRAVRGRVKKKDDHANKSKTLEESLQHTTTQQDESAAHVGEMVADLKEEAEIKSETRSLKESHIEQNDSITAQELKPEMVEQKAETKPKGRKRRESHVEPAQAETLEQETETKPTGRKRRESHIEQNETETEEELDPEKSAENPETKGARGRKRRESLVEPHTADSIHSDEPPHKRGTVATLQIEIDTKLDTPENVKAASRRTRKASALDSSQHSAHESDLSTGTPRRMRSRNVPRRAAAAQDRNYDESSDTEAQAEFKRRLERREYATTTKDSSMTEKPTTSRGRTRKPTAIVQQYLEEERAKADTPKRRLLLTARNETPTSESRHVPARRGRKASTIETEVLSTPQTTKRGRGKVAAATQATEVSEESRSEIEHASEQEETQSSHTEEKEAVPRVPSRSQVRRRGKAVQEHEVGVEAVESAVKQPVEGEPHEAVTPEVVPVASAKRGRARGRARTVSADTATEVAAVREETEDKPKSSARGRGTRARKAKPLEPVADAADVEQEAEQQEARRMASASTVAGSINEEDLLSVGIVAGSDSQMEAESAVAEEEEEDKPLAAVTAKAVKRTAAARKVASNTDSPAPKRGRRKAAAVDVAHASDETEANTTARSATGGRGRKVVRFEPADGAAATAAATAGPDLVDAAETVEPTEAAAVPPKRVTRTRRK